MDLNSRPVYTMLLVMAIIVNIIGINTPFFTDDPGLYASISKQMMYHHSWLQLYSYNQDWLDKPHFPFWVVLISFKVFGVHTWSYKLPALLFFFLGVIYTYLFAYKFYNPKVAAAAALILLTAQHVIMSNTDVRAEPYLIGLIMGSIYHISQLKQRFPIGHLLMTALLTAAAIMTKGIFVVIAIYGGLIGELIFTKSIFSLWNFKWMLLALLTLCFITPELYALYTQFDLHPEKMVFGHQHTSGIKFFLWDSQFGRFFNSGPIKRKSGSVFFFLHTMLWAYAPWCLALYLGFANSITAIMKGIKLPEYYTLCGGLLLLLLFSVSGFQLPFYTNILFPLFSIIAANVFYQRLSRPATIFVQVVQWVYVTLLLVVVLLMNYWLHAIPLWVPVLLLLCIVLGGIYLNRHDKHHQIQNLLFFSGFTTIAANLYLIAFFYPLLVSYKAEIKAADYVNNLKEANKRIYVFESTDNIFQFYTHQPVQLIAINQSNNLGNGFINYAYIRSAELDRLNRQNIKYSIVKEFKTYQHEGIRPQFINPQTRSQLLEDVYVIKL